ncbi:MAG: pitrilysin family protein [Cyanobacteria bacterium P01_D01_bin.105]
MTASTASREAFRSSTSTAPDTASATRPSLVIHRCPNGLTIVAEQMPIDAVNLSIWLNMGSAVEPDSLNGMAHFLEHMIFKGTPEIACGEFERLIEERGAVTNAATSQDYTNYYITTAPKDFADLAPLQIELVMNPLFEDGHFERERPVILEEIRRAEDSPQRRTFYRTMEMCFDELPYRRPVLGPTAVIEQLSATQMRDFHSAWYQPQNMTAVVVGNLPVEALVSIVEKGFEQALARSNSTRKQASTTQTQGLIHQAPSTQPEVPFPTLRRKEHIDESLQQARLVMGWRVPGMCDLDKTYPLDVVASILSRGRTSRLIDDLRERRHIVNGISASNMSFGHQGMFYISAKVTVENLAAAESAILEHIQQLHQEPVTEAELARVRTKVANQYVFGSETPSDRAGLYGYYQAMTGNIRHALDYPEHIRQVSAEAIQAAVQQYLPLDTYGVVTLKPPSTAAAANR